MSSAKQSANEQIHQLSKIQSKAFQPMRIFGDLAADAIEQVARKNYAVIGDFVEFSVKQVQLPLSGDNAQDIFSARMEEFSAFGELMNSRASEYVKLASAFSEHSRKAADDAAAQVREVADEVAVQTKRVADSAVVHTQEAIEDAADRTGKGFDDVKNAADDAIDSAKKAADDASEDVKDAAASASSHTKKTASNVTKSA